MGDKTGISWTDATWNPVTGCSKVSAGCKHCYAERVFPRAYHGQTVTTVEVEEVSNGVIGRERTRPRRFTDVRCHPERLSIPLRWKKPRRVFVNSMSDLFHEDVPDGFIARVWMVMAQSPQHVFQILTKRPERMRAWVERWADDTGDGDHQGLPPMPRGPEAVRATYRSGRSQLFAAALDSMGAPPEGAAYPLYDWMEGPRFWPAVLPNVWLGVSVEDQATADERIPVLLDTPAAVRFVSAEPLLGPVDLMLGENGHEDGLGWVPGPELDWVIVGGESGPKARPFALAWARSILGQCRDAGVPVFVKQLGANPTGVFWPVPGFPHVPQIRDCQIRHRAGAAIDEWPMDLRVQEWPR